MSLSSAPESIPPVDWLWHGYLARRNLTLLTSLWKAGKSTLVTGLIQRLESNATFLGLSCQSAKSLIVSEESRELWSSRLRLIPVGTHARLLARPFVTRPTAADWSALIDRALEMQAAGDLDLLVVDPLVTFLPGKSESDPGTLLDMLQPLQRLAETGAAVLILHHPRKDRSAEGNSARGTGALLGYVDIILELNRVGRLKSDDRRRRIVGLSRHVETPKLLQYQFDRTTGAFTVDDNPYSDRFQDIWDQVRSILKRRGGSTHTDMLTDWPGDQPRPIASALYDWLKNAHAKKLVERTGLGTRNNPYRYRLAVTASKASDRIEVAATWEVAKIPSTGAAP